ncbi:hypothetical protein BD626DRAFT_26854 [Schizophyllum amplum]|uniref:F-box domain-containing protein n=1 Tax=Schizophyllum amplum TaxID=97359 RepID=A0A550CZS2_9AGAR|nr:hypothetical protein BD626DRAFT_26854 [Auriculariopsis ampla]
MQTLQQISCSTRLCSQCDHTFTSIVGDSDLASFARSAYVPASAAEQDALRGGLSNLRDSLSGCELEIAHLERTLGWLRQQRALIEETATNVEALLAPVRRVPLEILGEIAPYTLPDSWFQRDRPPGSNVWPFAQVCCSWREVALGVRWLWAQIRLPCNGRGQTIGDDALLEAVSTYLQRSGQYPLSVTSFKTTHDNSQGNNDPRVWTELWAHAGRLRTLEVAIPERGFSFPPQLPMLHRLFLTDLSSDRSSTVSIDTAPHLQELELVTMRLSNTSVPWSNLQTLIVTGEVQGPDIDVLRSCSGLVRLHLLRYERQPNAPQNIRPVHFALLRKLRIGPAAVRACPLIIAPSLDHVEFLMVHQSNLRNDRIDEEDIPFLVDLLKPVQGLTLGPLRNYDVEILRAIISLPQQLKTLHLTILSTPIHRDLVRELIFHEANPAFTHLVSVGFTSDLDLTWKNDDILLVRRLVESRSAHSRGCTPLERLTFRYSHGSYKHPLDTDYERGIGKLRELRISASPGVEFVVSLLGAKFRVVG